MPTPIDRAINSNSRSAFLAFAGIVTAVSAWAIWGSDMFPSEKDPSGDPSTWEESELRQWLRTRGLMPDGKATKEELVERVKANLRPPPRNSS